MNQNQNLAAPNTCTPGPDHRQYGRRPIAYRPLGNPYWEPTLLDYWTSLRWPESPSLGRDGIVQDTKGTPSSGSSCILKHTLRDTSVLNSIYRSATYCHHAPLIFTSRSAFSPDLPDWTKLDRDVTYNKVKHTPTSPPLQPSCRGKNRSPHQTPSDILNKHQKDDGSNQLSSCPPSLWRILPQAACACP